ncbi:YrzE family protein [Pyramidobacter sp. YE332]|uniref:YrzE family protein n=2 Tax=unclassified Pyramidobacter TaxID=2632171 RepID=UPI00294B33D4|nr:YrzE family protein [Pyramidobacter sp. YE332]WOL40880.1 YrzE family protein [Pyramidobacter sp. YE332]
MNDNHPAPSAQPAAPQLPPEALNALIANQAREIDLREKELLTRQTEDKYSYEYAQTALKAQMQDNEKSRQYDIKKKRELYIFCGLVLFLIVLFVGWALHAGFGEFVKDLVKVLLAFAAGAVSGFQYGKKKN